MRIAGTTPFGVSARLDPAADRPHPLPRGVAPRPGSTLVCRAVERRVGKPGMCNVACRQFPAAQHSLPAGAVAVDSRVTALCSGERSLASVIASLRPAICASPDAGAAVPPIRHAALPRGCGGRVVWAAGTDRHTLYQGAAMWIVAGRAQASRRYLPGASTATRQMVLQSLGQEGIPPASAIGFAGTSTGSGR